jgi:hypothetical protein
MAGEIFERCPGGPGHVGTTVCKIECQACLAPSRDDLGEVLDALLIERGVALPRATITSMASSVRAYFAGRYGLPFEVLEPPSDHDG